MRVPGLVFVCGWWICAGIASADCVARDFLAMDLPVATHPEAAALAAAYPGVALDSAGAVVHVPGADPVAYAPARDIGDAGRLDGATVGDMFAQRYPLTDDPAARMTPWFDPGRVRNDALFRALYGDSAAEVAQSLVSVAYPGATGAPFSVTTRQCVATQLAAALAGIAALDPPPDDWFRDIGGSFNWRVIAGTNRLSAHSFGAAIDLNADLGGYWRWAGAAEGAVGAFDTAMPPEVVALFERYGFIWGGKWHHYDGMHFEYRPELIVYARLTAP